MTSVTYGARVSYSQKRAGSGRQHSFPLSARADAYLLSGEMIPLLPLSAFQISPSHWRNPAQDQGYRDKHRRNAARGAGAFPRLIVCTASASACRKIKKAEGGKKKGPPSTKALSDVRFRHEAGLEMSFSSSLHASYSHNTDHRI